MSDLIYRQAAIDAMCELMHHWFGGDPKDEVREINRELGKLPSAQQWIPCNERLPEYDGGTYLVTDYCEQIDRKRIHVSYCYMNKDGFWSDVPWGYKVIAWMPLPEPWRGEEDETD